MATIFSGTHRMQQRDVVQRERLAGGRRQGAPGLARGTKPARRCRPGIDDLCPPPSGRCGGSLGADAVPHCFHRPSSVLNTLSALIARGTPAYGVVWRIVSSISLIGTSIARSAWMWAATWGSQPPSVTRHARMISSRSRALEPGPGVHLAERPVHQPIGHRAAHPLEERLTAGVIPQLGEPPRGRVRAVLQGPSRGPSLTAGGRSHTVSNRGRADVFECRSTGPPVGPARRLSEIALDTGEHLAIADRAVPGAGRADQDHRHPPHLP